METMTETVEETTEQKRVWDKTSEEITVKDALKVNLTVMAVFGVIGAGLAATPVLAEKLDNWVSNRRLRRMVAEMEEAEETIETPEEN